MFGAYNHHLGNSASQYRFQVVPMTTATSKGTPYYGCTIQINRHCNVHREIIGGFFDVAGNMLPSIAISTQLMYTKHPINQYRQHISVCSPSNSRAHKRLYKLRLYYIIQIVVHSTIYIMLERILEPSINHQIPKTSRPTAPMGEEIWLIVNPQDFTSLQKPSHQLKCSIFQKWPFPLMQGYSRGLIGWKFLMTNEPIANVRVHHYTNAL